MRLAVSLGLLAAACASSSPFEETPSWPTPSRGAVVSEHPLATEEGLRILDAGGNAADAAVAMALTLAVVYPQAGNLGGGGFALWVPHAGKPESIDFRETAPSGFGPDLFLDEQGQVVASRSLTSPLAVGVPGSPAGLFELYDRFGSGNVRFATLCARAIALAEVGFKVDPWLARDLRSEPTRRKLEADPAARRLFYPDGLPLAEGERLVQPALAETLRQFSRTGARTFYRGAVAERILAALEGANERAGGVTQGRGMRRTDLESYTVRLRDPLVGWVAGSQIISMGPPSSGGVALLQILSVLDGFPLGAQQRFGRERLSFGADDEVTPIGLTPRAVHWWIEAMRVAFANRAEHLGDPQFHPVPLDELLSATSIAASRVGIQDTANRNVAAYARTPLPESDQTTHLSVIDRDGNAVSLTTTLNASFGSGILVPGAGFLLNNEIDDFSISPGTPNLYGLIGSEANQLGPGRRPLSSMTPTVVRAGGEHVSVVIGAPGGPRIITAVAQTLLRVLAYGEDPFEAVAAPRLHQQWRPEQTFFEAGWPEGLLEALGNRHEQPIEVQERGRFGSVQAIFVGPNHEPLVVSDPRRGGAGGVEGEPIGAPVPPEYWDERARANAARRLE